MTCGMTACVALWRIERRVQLTIDNNNGSEKRMSMAMIVMAKKTKSNNVICNINGMYYVYVCNNKQKHVNSKGSEKKTIICENNICMYNMWQ